MNETELSTTMNSWEKLWQNITVNASEIVVDIVVIVLTLIVAKVVLNRFSYYTGKTMEKAKQNPDQDKGKQIATSMTMLRSVGRYAIYFVALCIILNQLGFGVVFNNLLMTAGIGSLALSFGAQSVVKDVVTGLFLMFEKQYAVGDYVKIGEYEGTVTSIAMRVTYLRNFKGQKIIIPNGQVSTVINYTNSYNTASVLVNTPYEADTRKVMRVLQEVADQYYQAHQDIFVELPQVTGITAFNESSVDLTVVARVKALNHWQVERDLRLLIKERFDSEGIAIPYKQITVHTAVDETSA